MKSVCLLHSYRTTSHSKQYYVGISGVNVLRSMVALEFLRFSSSPFRSAGNAFNSLPPANSRQFDLHDTGGICHRTERFCRMCPTHRRTFASPFSPEIQWRGLRMFSCSGTRQEFRFSLQTRGAESLGDFRYALSPRHCPRDRGRLFSLRQHGLG